MAKDKQIECNVDFNGYFRDKKFTDISSELYREYRFGNGEKVRIEAPYWLNVSESGGHRIIDLSGKSHYIPPRWIHLYWEVGKGEYNFVT